MYYLNLVVKITLLYTLSSSKNRTKTNNLQYCETPVLSLHCDEKNNEFLILIVALRYLKTFNQAFTILVDIGISWIFF